MIQGAASEFDLLRGYVVSVPTLDNSVTAVSFGGSEPESSEAVKDALTFSARYKLARLLHTPRLNADDEIRMTPRERFSLL